MTDDRPDAAQELEYPPIRVDRSLAQLDLNTLIMRSNPRPAQEATSLEDSTYEVLDRPGYLSDDDGHTASVASTSPDNMSVTLSETESEGEDDFADYHNGEASQLAESTTPDPLDTDVIAAGEDSTLTERPGLSDSESSFHFSLDERPLKGLALSEGRSVVKEFTPEQSTSKVLKPYGCTNIRLSVAIFLARGFYPERGSFRVLFVGRLDTWSEEGIKTSILNALLASPGSSKSVMVRGQVERYSPVLHAAHCTGVQVQSKIGTLKRTIFKLDISDGADLVVSHGRKKDPLPDLAIFCYPQTSPAPLTEAEYLDARLACRESGIPTLDITDHRRFNEEHPGFKRNTENVAFRVCVEGKTDADFRQIDWLPVDVYTFMHLEPSDLNRHLAAISPGPHNPRQTTRHRHVNSWNPASVIPGFVRQGFKSLMSVDAHLKLGLLLFALTGLITAVYLGASIAQLQNSSTTPGVAQPPLTSARTTITHHEMKTSALQMSTPILSAPSVKDKAEDFAKQRDTIQPQKEKAIQDARKMAYKEDYMKAVAKAREKLEKKRDELRRREIAAKTAKIGGFEIQTSGDQQFILRPSEGFTGRTRKPQLQIQVSRDSKNVPIRYERTMDGVYVVDLENQYPVGPFNVSIATHSKPLMQQSFNIRLGLQKSRLEQWWSRLQRESDKAQDLLRDVSSNVKEQLEAAYARIAEQTHGLREKVERSEHDVTERVREATQHIDRQLHKVGDEVWTSLRQTTAPVRTSRRTLWARNNAHVWRCGFERMVGLSSREEDGKKTRSCEAANW
ncbi:hypothetical protein PMIN01_01690 [Paraphaeosphaeria minitans]|uniref:Uncharacterized protein n=1 Tax=Paraphaeosphaeria minitans TaxID=565426 RepID=A0A9P6GNS8_9PLEO|nr:hypothetical protein PMIN01_01690 [Paraphaeosphaeria minitans]